MRFECACPNHQNITPTRDALRCSARSLQDKVSPWYRHLSYLQQTGDTQTTEDAKASVGVWLDGNENRFFAKYPCFVDCLADYVPSAEVLLHIAQRNIGENVSAQNVESIRAEVEAIVRRKTWVQRQILLSNIASRVPAGTPLDDERVVGEIVSRYEPKINEIRNSGIAIAGRVHEMILMGSLEDVGLVRGTDFEKPQNPNQNGDIRVKARASGDYLATEVKSLKARERLTRGLREIGHRKVGAGFFDDASEFTDSLTEELVGISAQAVYMPGSTIQGLPANVRRWRNAAGNTLYRPITQYASDMRQFAISGRLP